MKFTIDKPGKVKKVRSPLRMAINHLRQFTENTITARTDFLKSLMDPEGRDLDSECGYITDPTIKDYQAFYRRHGIARKVVDVYPDETWATEPEIYVTEKGEHPWETKWQEIVEKHNIYAALHKLDQLCGIGRFGILYYGFDDVRSSRDLEKPVRGLDPETGLRNGKGGKKVDLLFLRPLDESMVTIGEYESNPWSPRCGMPKYYDVNFSDPEEGISTTDADGKNLGESFRIHWTRVLHLADNTVSSPILGSPRMEPVLNWLSDMRKISGGSAEMFWKGAFPGYSVETHPDVVDTAELDDESVKEQFQAYMNGLQRYLAMVGVTVKSLAPQVAEPNNHIETLYRLISTTLNTPMRIFTGSEAAHLASSQDGITWNRRLMKRQRIFVNPYILRPFIGRLMEVGVLPKVPKYHIDWMDLNALAAEDQADVALKKTQALMQYVSGGCELVIPPAEYFTTILGMTVSQAEMVMKEVAKSKKLLTEDFWKKPEPVGGITGSGSAKTKDPGKKTNRSRNSLGGAKT